MYDVIYIRTIGDDNGFEKIKTEIPHAIYLPDCTNLDAAIKKAASISMTEMYWIIVDDTSWRIDDLRFKPPRNDRQYPHLLRDGARQIYLLPRISADHDIQTSLEDFVVIERSRQFDAKPVATDTLRGEPYDIFFISYHEPHADHNWKVLRSRFPNARRVDGITGIHHAHRRCAELSETEMFYTVDADTVIDQTWHFDYEVPSWDRSYLHLWYSRNPVNDLAYGWGSIKLWPTISVLGFAGNWLDFTTTVGNIKIIPEVIATSCYNTDAFGAWRSGFRETVKLCHNIAGTDDLESCERLQVWLTKCNDVPFAQDSMQGSRCGVDYYINLRDKRRTQHAKLINDFAWVKSYFNTNGNRDIMLPEFEDIIIKLRGD